MFREALYCRWILHLKVKSSDIQERTLISTDLLAARPISEDAMVATLQTT